MGHHRGPDRRHTRRDVPEASGLDPDRHCARSWSMHAGGYRTGRADRDSSGQATPVRRALAVRGQGSSALRVNRLTGEMAPLTLHPSTATTLAHGFAMISRFFPGSRAELAAIDDEVIAAVSGPPKPGKAQSFEDQYISSGGQLYELMAGHDRFVADLRPLFERTRPGGAALCCHPYDLCTELIGRETGVEVTDAHGGPLAAPLDVTSD